MSAPTDLDTELEEVWRGSNLTAAQALVWLQQKRHAPLPTQHTALLWTISESIDYERFQAAFQRVVDECDALRTVVEEVAGVPQQRVLPEVRVSMEYLELLDAPHPPTTARAWAVHRAQTPFKLDACLFDSALLKLDESVYAWFLNQHRLIADGWSALLIFRRVAETYQTSLNGTLERPAAPPLFGDYVVAERQLASSPKFQKTRQYWQAKLATAPAPLPLGNGAANLATRRAHLSRGIGAARSQRLREIVAGPEFSGAFQNLGMFSLFTGLLLTCLFHRTGQSRIALGIPASARVSRRLEETAGLGTHTVVEHFEVAPGESLLALTQKVRGEMVEVLRQQNYVVSTLPPRRLYDAAINFCHGKSGTFLGSPVQTEFVDPGYQDDSQEKVALQVRDYDATGEFFLDFDFRLDAFDEERQQEFIRHFFGVLDAFLADQRQLTRDLCPTAPGEIREWADEGAAGRAAGEEEKTANALESAPQPAIPPRSKTEEVLARLWCEVLEVNEAGIHDNFFDLGGRSLPAVRLFARIEEELGVNLPISALLQGPTVAQLAAMIEHSDATARWPSLVPMQTGMGPALFCVHGVRGDILRFHDLIGRLDAGRPIYGLRARGLDGLQAPHESIEEMAVDYAAEIVAAQPQGPYHIVGYSFGGLVAYEIARQLTMQGREVALVGLIDTRRRVTRPLMLLNLLQLPMRQKMQYLRTLLRGKINDWRLGVGRAKSETGRSPDAATSRPERIDRVWHASLHAAESYEPQPYEGRLVLFRAKEAIAPAVMKRVSYPWENLAAGGLEVAELPCDHANILIEPEVRFLADRLEAKLAETGAPGSRPRKSSESRTPASNAAPTASGAPGLKQSQRIVKNVLATGVSTVIGGLIQLAALVIVGRAVSVDEFGVYSFILAFAMFVWVLADSGLSTILVRELATQPGKMAEILGAAMTLIWALSIGGELLILAVVPFLHLEFADKVLAAVMGLVTMTQFHCAGYSAALRAREDNDIQALGFLLHKILFFIFIVVGLKAGFGLSGVVAAHLIPNLCLWTFFRRVVVRRYGHPHLVWDFARWKYLLTHSLPVGGATMLRLAAEQADVLIIKLLSDIRTVGLFSGPYRISMAMRLIPQTMTVPLYPMYARLAQEEGARLPFLDAYRRSVKFFLLIAFPTATVFIIFSGQLLTILLKADYLAAIPAMQLLGLAFIPFFLSTAFPLLLTALHEQRFLLKTAAFSLTLRVLMNFALVPYCGFIGPCIAFLVSEVITVALWIHKLKRLGFPLDIWSILWRLTVAAGCMAALLYPFQGKSLLIAIPAAFAGSLIYLAIVWKLGTFTPADLALAVEGSGFLKRFLGERPAPLEPAE